MEHTHLLTAGEAARAVGISGAAISKAISSGRLPYVEKTKQGYLIDPSVLFHVFRGGRKKPAAATDTSGAPHIGDASAETIALRIANARLETELSGVRAVLHAERQRAETAERDRDGWRTLAQSIVDSKRHPNA